MNKKELIEQNINLVYFLVNKYYPTFLTDEDIIQAGMVGLCRAANDWDENKSKFSTYASHCIVNEIKDEFRARKKHKGTLSLDYETVDSDGDVKRFGDTIVGDEDVNWVDDSICDTLTQTEKYILSLKQAGVTNQDIAKRLAVSDQIVQQKVRKLKLLWRNTNGN